MSLQSFKYRFWVWKKNHSLFSTFTLVLSAPFITKTLDAVKYKDKELQPYAIWNPRYPKLIIQFMLNLHSPLLSYIVSYHVNTTSTPRQHRYNSTHCSHQSTRSPDWCAEYGSSVFFTLCLCCSCTGRGRGWSLTLNGSGGIKSGDIQLNPHSLAEILRAGNRFYSN